jgi:hypothetical protein
MADGFQVSNEDRQQFMGVFKDPGFYKKDGEAQREALSALPIFKNLPPASRYQLVEGILKRKDQIRSRVMSMQPAAPPASQAPPDSPLVQGAQKAGRIATTPISQMIGGPNATLQHVTEESNKAHPLPPQFRKDHPYLSGYRDFMDAASEQAAGVLDAIQTPLGIATAGFGNKIRGLATAAENPAVKNLLIRGMKMAEFGTRLGFTADQVKGVISGLQAVASGPTPQNLAQLASHMTFALGGMSPEIKGRAKRLAKTGEVESAKPAAAPEGGVHGDLKEHVRAAQTMPIDQLSAKVHEVRATAEELRDARRYNEQAGSALGGAEQKLAKLKQDRDAAELALKDTKEIDDQISGMQSKINAIRQKVSQNHSRIQELKGQKVEDIERLYTDALREKEAPPTPRGAKKYPAPVAPQRPGRPGLPPGKIPLALPAGKPQGAPVPHEVLPNGQPINMPAAQQQAQVPGQQPVPQIAGAAQAQLPAGSPTNAQGAYTGPGKTETDTALPPGPSRLAIAGVAERTPEGAVVSQPVTAEPPKPRGPVRGQLSAPTTFKGPTAPGGGPTETKLLNAPKHAYPPHTIETDENGKPITVIQGKAGTAEPPKPKQAAAPTAKAETAEPPKIGETKTAEPPKAAEAKPVEEKAGDDKIYLPDKKTTQLHRSEIHTDPSRFQFKGKAIGKGGVTEEMKDIEEYDPDSAGTLAVWKDPKNGKTYVVNGHHRLERANALNYEGGMTSRYLDAKTAKEARTKGALINIREGKGEPLDAAKVFREGGFTPADLKKYGISRNGPVAKQGLSLAKLDDAVFQDVATGKLPEGRGVVIGETLSDAADQKAAAKMAMEAEDKGKRMTDGEFRETLGFIKSAPKDVQQKEDLFGSFSVEKNLWLEKGQVSDYIKNQLATDKKLFSAVGKSAAASKLSEAGNTIAVDKNAAKAEQTAQAMDVYDRLKKMSGPMADILDSAAKELSEGGKPGEVKQRAYERVREQLERDLSSLHGGGKGSAGKGVSGAGESGSHKAATGVPAGEGRRIDNPEANAKGNDADKAKLQKARLQAELNSTKFQGDAGAPLEQDSPLFRGSAIDTREPQGSMFDEIFTSEPPVPTR